FAMLHQGRQYLQRRFPLAPLLPWSSFGLVAFFDSRQRICRQRPINSVKLLGMSYQIVDDLVDQNKELLGNFPVVLKVHLARMHRVVANDSDYIKGLLNSSIEPFLYKR